MLYITGEKYFKTGLKIVGDSSVKKIGETCT